MLLHCANYLPDRLYGVYLASAPHHHRAGPCFSPFVSHSPHRARLLAGYLDTAEQCVAPVMNNTRRAKLRLNRLGDKGSATAQLAAVSPLLLLLSFFFFHLLALIAGHRALILFRKVRGPRGTTDRVLFARS